MLPNVLLPNETDHVPVLAEEVRELLDVQPGETVVDATFGAGGHSSVLARDLSGRGRLIAVDRDPSVRPYFESFRRSHGRLQTRLLRGDFATVLRELADIFRRYGEERFARQIARAIVRKRRTQPFERTSELVETIKGAIPTPVRFGDGHPAKRVFQALRIAVNDELAALERALPAVVAMLRPGGRVAVISF